MSIGIHVHDDLARRLIIQGAAQRHDGLIGKVTHQVKAVVIVAPWKAFGIRSDGFEGVVEFSVQAFRRLNAAISVP